MRQLPLGLKLPDRAVFASFLPARNQEAFHHVRQLAAERSPGTLWLCGPPGCGKTHLLQAACALAQAAYLPLGDLGHLGVGVLEGLPLDCLCLDDLHTVIGDLDWERALFTLWGDIQERQGRLLVAAQSPPALLTWALPDLASRFAASAIYPLKPLDEAEQQAALKLHARCRGLEVPEETSRWLQRHFPRDMVKLQQLLDQLDEETLIAQRRLTVPFIREVLGTPGTTKGKKNDFKSKNRE